MTDSTRQRILHAAAEEMRVEGYKAASVSNVLNRASVSKGAMYHHFKNKQALGYAVFDEIFIEDFLSDWRFSISHWNPIDALCNSFTSLADAITTERLSLGCPVCNMANEMSGVDDGFRERTEKMFESLTTQFADMFSIAKELNIVRETVDPIAVSTFMVALMQGMMMQGKYTHDLDKFKMSIGCLVDYLHSFKQSPSP